VPRPAKAAAVVMGPHRTSRLGPAVGVHGSVLPSLPPPHAVGVVAESLSRPDVVQGHPAGRRGEPPQDACGRCRGARSRAVKPVTSAARSPAMELISASSGSAVPASVTSARTETISSVRSYVCTPMLVPPRPAVSPLPVRHSRLPFSWNVRSSLGRGQGNPQRPFRLRRGAPPRAACRTRTGAHGRTAAECGPPLPTGETISTCCSACACRCPCSSSSATDGRVSWSEPCVPFASIELPLHWTTSRPR
jgi:hypothetical protein